MLFGIVIYFVLSILIGLWAEKWHRSSVKYAIISLLLSPLIGAIILGFLGVNEKAIQKEKKDAMERKKLFKERLNNTWKEAMDQNGFGQFVEKFEKNNIDNFDIIMALTDYDLEKIGMENIGGRKKFLQFVKDFSTGKIKVNITSTNSIVQNTNR